MIRMVHAPSLARWSMAAMVVSTTAMILIMVGPERKRLRRSWRGRARRDYLAPSELAALPPIFVGRAREKQDLIDFLTTRTGDAPPVAVLVGPYGIGKSSLAAVVATELAQRSIGGTLVADLSRRRGPDGADRSDDDIVDDALKVLITGLKSAREQVAPTVDARVGQYHALTRKHGAIIVLDDADTAEVIARLLPASPRCPVIVTTADPGLTENRSWRSFPLKPLGEEQSMELLRKLISATWTNDDETCRRIATGLFGHPNAIRLTATQLACREDSGVDALSRIYADPATELSARRLRRREQPVTTPWAPTFNVALQVSYNLLGDEEKLGLRMIGYLDRPAFPAWMLSSLLDADSAQATRVLDRLSVAGFLTRTSADAVGVPVLRVNEDVLHFARSKFEEDSRASDRSRLDDRIRTRKADRKQTDVQACVATARRQIARGDVDGALGTARRAVDLAREDDRESHHADEGLALATLAELHMELGAAGPTHDLATAVLDRRERNGAVAWQRAQRCAARLARRTRRRQDALDLLVPIVDTANAADPGEAEELVLALLEMVVLDSQGGPEDQSRAWRNLKWATRVCAGLPDEGVVLQTYLCRTRSYILQAAGKLDAAEQALVEAERWALRRAERLSLAWTAYRRAMLLRAGDDPATATRHAREALHAFGDMGHRYGRARAARLLGDIHADALNAETEPAAEPHRQRAVMCWIEARDGFTACGDLAEAAEVKALLDSMVPDRRPTLAGQA
ncbi:hypothetical protein GCM10010443_67030 [Actinoplanes cyaneus]